MTHESVKTDAYMTTGLSLAEELSADPANSQDVIERWRRDTTVSEDIIAHLRGEIRRHEDGVQFGESQMGVDHPEVVEWRERLMGLREELDQHLAPQTLVKGLVELQLITGEGSTDNSPPA